MGSTEGERRSERGSRAADALGIRLQTRAFLDAARAAGADQTVDERRRRLIDVYFSSRISVADLGAAVGVSERCAACNSGAKCCQILPRRLAGDRDRDFLGPFSLRVRQICSRPRTSDRLWFCRILHHGDELSLRLFVGDSVCAVLSRPF